MRSLLKTGLVLWLLSLPAHADTLTFTTGQVVMVGPQFDTCASGFITVTCQIGGGALLPPLDGTTTLSFDLPYPNPTSNLILNFVYDAVKWDALRLPIQSAPDIEQPFSMYGTWLREDGRIDDVVGYGTMLCCSGVVTSGKRPVERIDVRFVFEEGYAHSLTHGWVGGEWVEYGTVPEPATIVLVGVGLLMLVWVRSGLL